MNRSRLLKTTLYVLAAFTPAHAAFAQEQTFDFSNFGTLVTSILNTVLRPLIPLLFGIAIVVLLWGIAMRVRAGDNAVERAKGNMFMLSGVIGLFVMIAVWAIVGLVAGTFGVSVGLPQFGSQ
jgi:hypothetical protein